IFLIDRNTTGRLYLNDGTGRFTEKTKTGVDAVFADGRGSATLDVNQDGRLDIYAAARGGFAVDDKTKEEKPYGRNYFFRNDIINGKNYLQVKILDANENVAGIGAKIYIYRQGSMDNASALLGYREVLSANGYKSQSSLIQHFGLDAASSVDVKVVFPDRTEQRFTNVTANQVFTVRAKRIDAAKLVRDFNTAQQAIAGEAYEIAYKTLAADNTPVPGFPVTFTIKSGNGSFSSSSSVTTKSVDADQNGRARVDWYLGPLVGANQIEATAANNGTPLSGSPDGYQVVSSAGAPFSVIKSAGDAQNGFINEQLPLAITARVTDKNGNAIANHPVEFTISSGNGKLKNGSSLTTQLVINSDGNGNAAAVWVLGDVIGQQSVYARSTYSGNALQNSPLTFTATAQRPLRKLSYVSGDRQTAQINTMLADPLRVRLVDTDNVPVTGESIVYKSLTSGAKFSGSDSITVSTDSQGYAGARPTLGSVAGDTLYVFEARARNASGSPVTFKASALTGPPAKIIYVSGNNQSGPAGRVLPQTLKVRLLDNLDNPVKGYEVQYNVTEGGGSFNGQQNQLIKSDAQGYAEIRWRLGERIGKNTATATAVNTSLPQITFSATGVVGPAARLVKNGGDNQKGNAGQPLGQYFVVSVTDSFYNTVSNHSVTFQVIQGNGSINGRTQVTQTTNPFGQAQVLYTMGPIDYEQKVQATAELSGLSLIDSPQVFRAVLGPGEPESMNYIGGNNQIGRVNEELPEPFIVQIVDKNGIGVPNHEVEFVTFSQGAAFAGETSIKVRSNTDGFALATATIGSVYGTNNYAFEAISRYNSKSLKNSPFQFFASGRKSTAKKMLKPEGEIIYSGTVGQFLADSLQVLVLDAQDQPVPAHPVTFSVAQGVIFIEGQRTSYETLSDEHGIARVAVKLATTPGSAVIRASSDDGVNPLSPAVLEFQVIALVGAADASMSSITATNNVLANGQNLSNVAVKLRDRFNNPIINQYVTLQTAGIEVFVNQPALPTDANGSTSATISSINIGKVMIYALVNSQPIVTTEIEFVAGLPQIVSVENNGQTYEKGKTLPNKVGVFIQDGWIHPVKNTEVQFFVTSGQGSIAESQPVMTAEDGKA
ncbi:MAG: hypothetical protein EHM72_16365, partial [Calditrichaeota bacterium]